jgi:hypothetical protein
MRKSEDDDDLLPLACTPRLSGGSAIARGPGATRCLLVALAIAAWTMPGLISRGIVILAVANFAPRPRR